MDINLRISSHFFLISIVESAQLSLFQKVTALVKAIRESEYTKADITYLLGLTVKLCISRWSSCDLHSKQESENDWL